MVIINLLIFILQFIIFIKFILHYISILVIIFKYVKYKTVK